MSASGLPGNLVEAIRAGMTKIGFNCVALCVVIVPFRQIGLLAATYLSTLPLKKVCICAKFLYICVHILGIKRGRQP